MQAHPPIALNGIMQSPHRDTNLPGNISAVNGMPDIAGQHRLHIPENLELSGEVSTRGPFHSHNVGKGTIDCGKQGFLDRRRSPSYLGRICKPRRTG